jgi:hypothetical protein
MLRCVRCGIHKKYDVIRYAELMFLHPIGSIDHVVHSGASRPQNVDVLVFMLRWEMCCFYKKYTRTNYIELVFFIR